MGASVTDLMRDAPHRLADPAVRVIVAGSVRTRAWTDADGAEHTRLEVPTAISPIVAAALWMAR